jgi:hypothetical protein
MDYDAADIAYDADLTYEEPEPEVIVFIPGPSVGGSWIVGR